MANHVVDSRLDPDPLYLLFAAPTLWYCVRVRDDGAVGVVYYSWSTTDPTEDYPGGTPIGSWVDKTILESWWTNP